MPELTLTSPLTTLLGIEYPILQGGMAWIADGNLAAAVSKGGGLGIIAAMNADATYLKEQISILRSKTDKPFGVNIMLQSPYASEAAQVVIDEKVPVVTTGAGIPSSYMPAWLAAQIKVIPVVASVDSARLMERLGATAVIAEGAEAGGHIGELGSIALWPLVSQSIGIPLIAAGGIADGRGLAAAFLLGAQGAQMGTRFLLAEECNIHPNYVEMVQKAKDISTIVTGRRFGGGAVRALKNPFTRNFLKEEYAPDADPKRIAALGSGALRLAVINGDKTHGCFMAGQVAGLINTVEPAAEICSKICQEAAQILKGAEKWVK